MINILVAASDTPEFPENGWKIRMPDVSIDVENSVLSRHLPAKS